MLIAHISDLHFGTYLKKESKKLLQKELKNLSPQIIVVSGDLTSDGYREEFEEAFKFIKTLPAQKYIVVPGNHDAKNVGYIHFEEFFTSRSKLLSFDGITLYGVDSSEPDLNEGRLGREVYPQIYKNFSLPAKFKIFILHHHLIPIPGTGRERNILIDAGDILTILMQQQVNLALCGHKHVPHLWRLENLYIMNAGTATSFRYRGKNPNSYNLIEIKEGRCNLYQKNLGKSPVKLRSFSI